MTKKKKKNYLETLKSVLGCSILHYYKANAKISELEKNLVRLI